MEAIKFIAAQVIAGQQYSTTLLRVTLKAYRAEQAKKVETAKVERYEKITVRAKGCNIQPVATATKSLQAGK